MSEILKLENVTKHFGGIIACNDLSFGVGKGRTIGIIGPNGAGKTTLFNLITGVYNPTHGAIIYNDKHIQNIKPDVIVKMGIARTFQNIRLFNNLSLLENIIIALDTNNTNYSIVSDLLWTKSVRTKERQLKEMAMEYLREVGLEDKANLKADSLPYGLQRKLEIARALALQPELLLLDEPAAGMNPEESLELTNLIRILKGKFNLTILLIEHHMDVVMGLCDKIVVMNFGEKIAEGTPEEIQNDPIVLKAYLGGEHKNANHK